MIDETNKASTVPAVTHNPWTGEAMIEMRVKRLHLDAKLPVKARPGDSGFDLFAHALAPVGLWHGDRVTVPTGIAIELPPGWEAQVRPRSGLASRGVMATLGTVDNGFRGEIGVTIYNLSGDRVKIEPGDRIAQLCIARVPDVRVV